MGVDLYNHGYHWEAHEFWEALWHGEGREGDVADLLKGLIQTAAAHVKARQNCTAGVRILAAKSCALLEDVARSRERLAGLDVGEFVSRHRAHFASAELPDPSGALPIHLDEAGR